MTKGSALITGASGFIGTHLARRLAAAGVRPVCLDLKPPRERLPGAVYITADIRNLTEVDIPEIDAIWNLAAVHTTPGHPDHEYYDTNVNGALEVVRLADRCGVRSIVFTSSISIYGPSEDRKTEDSAPAPTSAYGKSKLMAERIHQNWQTAAPDRRLMVVRPAVVFGPGEGGNFTRMAALLKKGFFVFPGRRDTIKSCIYVDDLLDLMADADARGYDSVVINGAYPECPTLEYIVSALKTRYFANATLIDVPRTVVLGGASLIGSLNGVGGIHPDRVRKLLKSTHVYPQWAADRQLLPTGALDKAIDRWASATDRQFV